jgi:hypothetical protein
MPINSVLGRLRQEDKIVSLRPAWDTQEVLGQRGMCSKTMRENRKK